LPENDVLIIGAPEVEAALKDREEDVLEAVKSAYESHSRGASSLPHSSFLRFPDSDKDRIICLPAYQPASSGLHQCPIMSPGAWKGLRQS